MSCTILQSVPTSPDSPSIEAILVQDGVQSLQPHPNRFDWLCSAVASGLPATCGGSLGLYTTEGVGGGLPARVTRTVTIVARGPYRRAPGWRGPPAQPPQRQSAVSFGGPYPDPCPARTQSVTAPSPVASCPSAPSPMLTAQSYWYSTPDVKQVQVGLVLHSLSHVVSVMLLTDPLGYTVRDAPSIDIHIGVPVCVRALRTCLCTHVLRGQGCIRRERASEAAPEARLEGGWMRFSKRLGAVTVGYQCL